MVTAVGPAVSVAVTPPASTPHTARGSAVSVAVTAPAGPAHTAKGPAVSVAVTARTGPARTAVGPAVTVAVSAPNQLYAKGGQPLKMYAKGGAPLRMFRKAPTLTYPRTLGAFGSYMPNETNTGVPAEFISQLVPWEGDKIVTDPYEVIDLLDIRGHLIFQVPFMQTPPQRFRVLGRPLSAYNGVAVGLVDCTSSAIRTPIEMHDFTVQPRFPNEFTVGIDGHHWDAHRPLLLGLQDGYRARNGGADGRSNSAIRGGYIDRLTYFRVASDRATSEQTHNDGGQIIGAKGHTVEGTVIWARYGPGGTPSLDGTKAYPGILDNTGTLWGANNDHAETACLQINVAGNGDKVQDLLVDKSWLFGGYYPINAGDTGNDGTVAAPWVLGEIRNSFADSADKHGSPPYWINARTQQAFRVSNNKWFDGPKVGQDPGYRGGVAPAVVAGPTRPTGVDYVTIESLTQPGDTSVNQALNRLTTAKFVTFPLGRFEFSDFNTGFQAGMTVPPLCKGIIGSGTGTIGSVGDATVFAMKAGTSTKGNGATFPRTVNGVTTQVLYVPPDGSSEPNQLNLIKHYPAVGNDPLFENFRIEGLDQGHSFHGMQVVSNANKVTVRNVLITGCVGTKGVPPEETFSLQLTGGTGGHLIENVEVDGRRVVGGDALAAVGITVQNSVGATVKNCTVRYCRAAQFVAYQSFDTLLQGGLYDSASAGALAVGNGGLNFEQTSGSRVVGVQIVGRAGKLHITFSNGSYTRTVNGKTYSTVNGTLEVLDCTWNPQNVNNAYLYVQSWAPYFLGSDVDINSMTYPGAVDDNGKSITGPSGAPWVHNSNGTPANLLWILGKLRQLNPTPNAALVP